MAKRSGFKARLPQAPPRSGACLSLDFPFCTLGLGQNPEAQLTRHLLLPVGC